MAVSNIKQRIKEIDEIYQKYLIKLQELKRQQAKIMADFIKEVEARKIEEIKKRLDRKA